MVLGMGGGDSSNPIITAMNPGSSGSSSSGGSGNSQGWDNPFADIAPDNLGETTFGKLVEQGSNIDASEIELDGPADTSGNESLYSGSEPFWNNQDVNMGLPDFNPQGMIQDGMENFQQNSQNAVNNAQNLFENRPNLPGIGLQDIQNMFSGGNNSGGSGNGGSGFNLPGIGLQDFQNMLPGNNSGGSGSGGLGLFEKTLIAGVAIVTLPAVIKELGDN